ncbi:hypothetical protein D7X55_08695 [Corallococcus sp. AB049A]|nr:hypothetical protein D7X55_08695 [Corallococcus sp. AB049A]
MIEARFAKDLNRFAEIFVEQGTVRLARTLEQIGAPLGGPQQLGCLLRIEAFFDDIDKVIESLLGDESVDELARGRPAELIGNDTPDEEFRHPNLLEFRGG